VPTWLDDTRARLQAAPRWLTLSQIATDTGLQVSWLSAFAGNKITDPGIQKVQALYDYLCIVPTGSKPERIKFAEHKNYPADDAAAGVYVIWSNDLCVYVGTSHKMFKRLRDHARDAHIMQHGPTHVDLVYVDGNDVQRHALERTKINALAPVVNVQGNGTACTNN